MAHRWILLSLMLMAFLTDGARASTILPPAHYGEMVRHSDVVVKAEIGESSAVWIGGLLYTQTGITILETFKGDYTSGERTSVFFLGGELGDIRALTQGSPELARGEVALLSLKKSFFGLSFWLLSYGQLRLTQLPDGSLVYRHLETARDLELVQSTFGEVEVPQVYGAAPLEAHLADLVAGAASWDAHSAGAWFSAPMNMIPGKGTAGVSPLPAGCSMLEAGGIPSRWQTLDGSGSLSIFMHQGAHLAGRDAIEQSLKQWAGIPGTNLGNIQFRGTKALPSCDAGGILDPVRSQFLEDNEMIVVFDDPCGNLDPAPSCVGILATAQHFASKQTHLHRGVEWANLSRGVIVVNKGVQSCLSAARFQQTIQHEVGHLLGFGHHTIEPANMNATCCNPLMAKDIACAQFVYSNMRLHPTPVISQIVPNVVQQGTTTAIMIEGTGFMAESTVAVGGSDIVIEGKRYVDDTRMEVTLVTQRSAVPSFRAFRVTNPAPGGGRSQDFALTVVASTQDPETDDLGVPFRFDLGNNYPNPFNPTTIIPFELPWRTHVRMVLLDTAGRTIKTLVEGEIPAGRHTHVLVADGLPTGSYIVRLDTEFGLKTAKITLVK